jgi:hypothetical protein
MMKPSLFALTLAVLVTFTFPSAFSQQGTVFTYTIHVDFFAYSCSLSVAQVSLYDSSGNLVGVGSSPYGGEVEISIRTPTPVTTLTATASGVATWGSYYSWPVNGSRSLTLGSTGDYWITIAMNN